ncbi:hypothetical protein C8A03DRAFT_18313 [Achaetomium macrosporum]|uniref:Uncharacterized protein n=1 Tax=Achaetomium macrosporum TaxID=79813 RepID=A0AAN7C3R5_9PEZI|nr:hypothetical protein C8A03DRAFT_18313 [Achaetomium macrosporum]
MPDSITISSVTAHGKQQPGSQASRIRETQDAGSNADGGNGGPSCLTSPNLTANIVSQQQLQSENGQTREVEVVLKKRKYTPALSKETKQAVYVRLKSIELQLRVTYLLYLTDEARDSLIEHNLNDIEGGQAAYVKEYAASRIMGNCSNWQLRCIDNLIALNKKMCRENSLYKNCTNLASIRDEIKMMYSPQLFVEVFDFANNYIDVAGSGEDVQKWCKILFVELASRAKLVVDYEASPESKRLSDNDRPSFIHWFKTMCTSNKFKDYRPDPSNVKQYIKPRASKRARKERRQFVHPDDNDDDVYVPSD